jgi:hypothetical protein
VFLFFAIVSFVGRRLLAESALTAIHHWSVPFYSTLKPAPALLLALLIGIFLCCAVPCRVCLDCRWLIPFNLKQKSAPALLSPVPFPLLVPLLVGCSPHLH